MLIIEENKIYLTKGDDGVLPVDVHSGDGEYTMNEADVLTLTVRELPSADSPILMQVQSNPGSNRIIISAKDSADMTPGQYSADIQLTNGSNRKYTLWPLLDGIARYRVANFKNFILMPEVTV